MQMKKKNVLVAISSLLSFVENGDTWGTLQTAIYFDMLKNILLFKS